MRQAAALGSSLNACCVSIFSTIPSCSGVQLGQPVLQLMNIIGLADERKSHEIGVSGDKRQILGVLGGQRREPQSRVREIDALLRRPASPPSGAPA